MSETTRDAPALPSAATRRRVVFAGAIGSAVEYYDYGIYGYLATTFAVLFFPSGDPTAALLATFAVFAVSFVARPLGGIFFGHVGDRLGRRSALATAVIVMSLGTFSIGLLPSYATIGYAAPLLLVVARLVQGLSAGGENPGAASYVAEISPPARRGLLCSMPQVGSNIGLLVASGMIGTMNLLMTTEQINA
ncbi:MAG: MFS transporter, partial [Actinomycetes bacterium]